MPAENPHQAFNFTVEITVPGMGGQVCQGAFSECDGLEATLDVRSFRQGGDPSSQVRLVNGLTYGTVTLRRGLTSSLHPWEWMAAVAEDPSLRAEGEVVVLGPDGSAHIRYILTRCLPSKVKAPALNAKDGGVAVEELGLLCERIEARAAGGLGIGIGVGVGIGVGLSGGIGSA